MFKETDLQNLVNISGYALELEDRFLIGCTTVNRQFYTDKDPPGILRIINERYYQFVILKALMSCFNFGVEIEKKTFDIRIFDTASPNKSCAVGEIKKWMSSTGKSELPLIEKDINKLNSQPESAFMLIITESPMGTLSENIESLGEGVPNLKQMKKVTPKTFPTIGWNNAKSEFAVLGYLVK